MADLCSDPYLLSVPYRRGCCYSSLILRAITQRELCTIYIVWAWKKGTIKEEVFIIAVSANLCQGEHSNTLLSYQKVCFRYDLRHVEDDSGAGPAKLFTVTLATLAVLAIPKPFITSN